MADIEELLDIAGVVALKAEPLDWDGEKDCFVLTIDQSSAMESWRKLGAVAERTGHFPVFPADGDIKAFESTTEKALEQIREFQKTHPLPTVPNAEAAHQRMQDVANAFTQAAPMMEGMMKMFGMTHDKVDEVFRPPTPDQQKAAAKDIADPHVRAERERMIDSPDFQRALEEANKKANHELVDHMGSQPRQIANMFANMPTLMSRMAAAKKFEQLALAEHCKAGERPSLQALIASGESLDIDKWLELKRDSSRKVGDFSKQKYHHEEPPTTDTLLLLPVKKSWHIPAVLRVGSGEAMGDHPPAHIHVAMLKRWNEKYRAELVTIGRDVMYLTVKAPATTQDDALKLAIEQFAYCPNIVLGSVGDCTLSGGAIDVLDSKCWQFWWN
jgi:Domain of unknown function (DUF4253)